MNTKKNIILHNIVIFGLILGMMSLIIKFNVYTLSVKDIYGNPVNNPKIEMKINNEKYILNLNKNGIAKKCRVYFEFSAKNERAINKTDLLIGMILIVSIFLIANLYQKLALKIIISLILMVSLTFLFLFAFSVYDYFSRNTFTKDVSFTVSKKDYFTKYYNGFRRFKDIEIELLAYEDLFADDFYKNNLELAQEICKILIELDECSSYHFYPNYINKKSIDLVNGKLQIEFEFDNEWFHEYYFKNDRLSKELLLFIRLLSKNSIINKYNFKEIIVKKKYNGNEILVEYIIEGRDLKYKKYFRYGNLTKIVKNDKNLIQIKVDGFIKVNEIQSSEGSKEANIIDGIGISDMIVEQTFFYEVVDKYGNNYKLKEYYTGGYKIGYKISYLEKGLSFNFDWHNVLKSINMYYPFKGLTLKNISLQNSKMKDILYNYGESSWYSTSKGDTYFLDYDGIRFHTKPENNKSEKEEYLDSKISEISIISE